jgi:hypothetical protein
MQTQKELTPIIRSIVLDWMMDVAACNLFKRETFHLAACYFDRYLSLRESVSRSQFQLIGATALLLAAKFEEVQTPSVQDLIKATAYTYEGWEVCAMEQSFVKVLGWNLLPGTLNQWVNYLLVEWDKFAKEVLGETGLLFRDPREASYKLYRSAMHLTDVLLLDLHHKAFLNSSLAAAVVYSILNRCFAARQQRWSSAFAQFCAEVLGILSFETMRPAYSYVESFAVPEDFSLPKVRSRHYEESLSLQMHSAESLRSIRTKYSL